MLLLKSDGSGWIEINWTDSNLRMACAAEDRGDKSRAWFFFNRALYGAAFTPTL